MNKMICVLKNQHIKITGLLNGAVKKTTDNARNFLFLKIIIVSRHLVSGKCFQKPRYPAV